MSRDEGWMSSTSFCSVASTSSAQSAPCRGPSDAPPPPASAPPPPPPPPAAASILEESEAGTPAPPDEEGGSRQVCRQTSSVVSRSELSGGPSERNTCMVRGQGACVGACTWRMTAFARVGESPLPCGGCRREGQQLMGRIQEGSLELDAPGRSARTSGGCSSAAPSQSRTRPTAPACRTRAWVRADASARRPPAMDAVSCVPSRVADSRAGPPPSGARAWRRARARRAARTTPAPAARTSRPRSSTAGGLAATAGGTPGAAAAHREQTGPKGEVRTRRHARHQHHARQRPSGRRKLAILVASRRRWA